MKKLCFIIWAWGCIVIGKAQSDIVALEYFVDLDPGFGNATSVAIPPAPQLTDFVFNVDMAPLSEGLHTLSVRTQSQNGQWSLAQHSLVYKPGTTANLTAVEYFINTDPGLGNATSIPIGSSLEIINLNQNIDLSTLPEGLHRIGVRSKDANGHWSLTNWQLVYRPGHQAQLTQLEYFFDTDPGFGNGSSITVSPDLEIADLSQSMDLSALTEGLHRLGVRSKDANGHWSLTNWQLVYRPGHQAQLTQLEYFFDTDPGFGNGSSITVSPDLEIADLSQSMDLSTLTEGFHRLAVRSKDAEGRWSLTNWQYLYRAPDAPADLVKLEYFFETDPGFGNGTQVSFPVPNDELIDFVFPPSTQGVSPGLRDFYVRVWDGSHWSMTGALNITINQVFPVEWLYFEAIPGEDHVQLEWGTAQERNTDHFVLERSYDGRAFMPLGTVPAQGNADTPTYYVYEDAEPLQGTNYYRLKQMDLDGSFSLSEIRQAHFTKLPSLKVYPNPSQGKIYVSGLTDEAKIRITDAQGKQVLVPSQQHHATYEAQLDALPAGIYQITIETPQQQQTYRILKL